MLWDGFVDPFLRKNGPLHLSTAYATTLTETLTTVDRKLGITGRVNWLIR